MSGRDRADQINHLRRDPERIPQCGQSDTEAKLSAEQKFERSRHRRMRQWRKQAKRVDIRFEDETGEPFDPEDEWDRDARK